MIVKSMIRVALVVIALSCLTVTLASIPADQPSEGAFKWMRSLSQAERTFYLQDAVLRSLPIEYRQVLLSSITKGTARAAFWRTAFSTYRVGHRLAPQQAAALDRVIARLTPEAMDGSASSVETMRALEASLNEALGPAAVAELTYMTRADVASRALPLRERVAYEWRHLRAEVAARTGLLAAPVGVPCNCNAPSECTGPGNWDCRTSSCTSAIGNCGPFVECTKYCVEVPTR